MRITLLWPLLVFSIAVAAARPAAAIPSDDLLKSLTPTADVNDFAHILSPAEKAALEAKCRVLRDKTGAQLAVVTIKSLQGGEIEDFTNKLFARWGIGQKEKKNGLLLLVAMDDHRSRIEVGYGLEPIIPDMLAGRILNYQLKPRFREQRFAAGLSDSVDKLTELVEKGEPADQAALQQPGHEAPDKFATVLFTALFVAAGALMIGIGLGLPKAGVMMIGAFFGGMPAWIAFAVAGAASLFLHIPVAIAAAVLGYKLAKQDRSQWFQPSHGSSSPWNWSDYSGGGWSSGGWSSGGGGGGGFSQGWGGFGGGSSGGGGASGSW